jgi:hypothetical protein
MCFDGTGSIMQFPTTSGYTMSAIDLFAAFATNETTEKEGTPTQIPGAGDTIFTVARSGNKNYAKLIQRLVKQHRAVLDSKGDAAEAKSDEIFVEVLAKTVLLGWEGKVNIKGEWTSYSYDAAVMLLKLKEFRVAVGKVAEDMENFKVIKDEEDAKN